MNSFLKVEVEKSDRNIVLWFEQSKLVGLNYWQGIGDNGDPFNVPDPKLFAHCMEFYRNRGEEYDILVDCEGTIWFSGPYFDEEIKCIDDAIWDYVNTETTHKVTLPKSQVELIRQALAHYRNAMEHFIKFPCPTDIDEFEMFDIRTLEALMCYDVEVTLPVKAVESFAIQHGMDFPQYL